MFSLCIRNGRLIDPCQNLDRVGDLWIDRGTIAGIDLPDAEAAEVIDATGLIVTPGLIDMHVSLREPGQEEDETIATGSAAALAGGCTAIACMPDTNPVVDNRGEAEFVTIQAERAGRVRVLPLGAVTKNCAGQELAEIGQLVDAGVLAFSDGRQPVANAEIMRRALQYAGMFDRPIFNRPQVPELVANGVMHDGFISTRLGLRGMPAAAEEIMVGRDIALAELTGGRVHLLCISTEQGVEQIRRAKQRGVRVTAEVAVHHLALTDDSLRSFDPNYKVDPPLRSAEHMAALVAGLRDGTIDAICSDHQPHSQEKKECELDLAPFGIIGLETLLPLRIRTLIDPGHLTWLELIRKLSTGPASILGTQLGSLQTGRTADVTLIDPDVSWIVDSSKFQSRSRNTPFHGWEMRGRAKGVVRQGRLCWSPTVPN